MLKLMLCIGAGAIIMDPSLLSVDSLVKYRDVILSYLLAVLVYPWLARQFE